MTRGSRPAKSSQGRARLVRPGRIRGAGFKPRHKPTRLSPSTACADLPAQSPPYDVDVRACLSGSMFTNHHSRITIHKQAKKSLPASFLEGPARQPCARFVRPPELWRRGLTATADPTRIGILSEQRESKELSSKPTQRQSALRERKANKRPARQHRGGLTATFVKSKIESTCSKQTTYEDSNRNKNAHPPRTDVQPESASAEESRILRSGRIRGPKDLSCGPKWEYASSSQILIYGTGIRNRSKVLKT
jgi:hypothetical protein